VKSARNSRRATPWNCSSISVRNAVSPPSAFTVSMPLIASIWYEWYRLYASSSRCTVGRNHFTDASIINA
jgi:hypothetical protein